MCVCVCVCMHVHVRACMCVCVQGGGGGGGGHTNMIYTNKYHQESRISRLCTCLNSELHVIPVLFSWSSVGRKLSRAASLDHITEEL